MRYFGGTSAAAPHVAAAAALVLSANPALAPREVAAILRATAMRDVPADSFCAHGAHCGAGFLDAEAAVLAARAPQPAPVPSESPTTEPSSTPIAPTGSAPDTPVQQAGETAGTEDGGLDGTTTAVALAGAGVVAATAATVTVMQVRGRRKEDPKT